MAEQENKEKTAGQKLKDELFYKSKNTYEALSEEISPRRMTMPRTT